jgi:hypothetical protein
MARPSSHFRLKSQVQETEVTESLMPLKVVLWRWQYLNLDAMSLLGY